MAQDYRLVKDPSYFWKVECKSTDERYVQVESDIFAGSTEEIGVIIAEMFCEWCSDDQWHANIDIQKDYPKVTDFTATFIYSLSPISKEQYNKEMFGGLLNGW